MRPGRIGSIWGIGAIVCTIASVGGFSFAAVADTDTETLLQLQRQSQTPPQAQPQKQTPQEQRLSPEEAYKAAHPNATPTEIRLAVEPPEDPDYISPTDKQATAPDDVLTVRRRAIKDKLPLGAKVGGFLVSPGIEVQGTYDDNIFRTSTGQKQDWITDVKPALAIQSDWERNVVFLGAEGDFGFYQDNNEQSFSDYGVLASAQYDIADETYLLFGASEARRHQALGTVTNTTGNQPVSYKSTTENVEFVRAVGRIQLDMTAQNQDISLSGGIPSGFAGFDDVLDRNDKSMGVTLKYETAPDNDFFVSTLYERTRFALPSSAEQTSDGTNNKLGFDFKTAHGIAGSVFGGYLQRTYEAGAAATRKPYAGFNVGWDITTLTKLTLLMDKNFHDETVEGAAGVIQTMHKVTLDQKLSLSLLATLFGGMDNVDYVGGDPTFDRATKVYYGGGGFKYRLSDGVGLKTQYEYTKRDSALSSDHYTDNRAYVSLLYMY